MGAAVQGSIPHEVMKGRNVILDAKVIITMTLVSKSAAFQLLRRKQEILLVGQK